MLWYRDVHGPGHWIADNNPVDTIDHAADPAAFVNDLKLEGEIPLVLLALGL
jgi:hypothetical protein